jgi:prephenate dehydrogenase
VAVDRGESLSMVAGADLVVLATPVLEIIRILPQLRAHVSADTVVTDTGSTKSAIAGAAGGMRFIGGHPIAGAAPSGRGAARADLFNRRTWVLTPPPDARAEDLRRLSDFIAVLGAQVRLLDPVEHDRIFALVSHLPQLAVSAMMSAIGAHAGKEGLVLSGAGLRDSTRLAASAPDIWSDIVRTNRTHIAAAIDALISELTDLRNDESGDALRSTFENAIRWKRILDERSI